MDRLLGKIVWHVSQWYALLTDAQRSDLFRPLLRPNGRGAPRPTGSNKEGEKSHGRK